ncbi:cell division ATP-binding protein FtsE [Candidatus Falkowbacteria bacterium CG_4_9_14_3_um_filter_36_9]|uniref:Cell division ATP-binding protein FtsE n=2 Tax=Candidatus Falkowiibacteriota TaxID=1752728 RepID=A0A1J4TDP3_9BACT|nr:MAG: cell division ATP-binding protein FtsE [Candidatus Falkowbacteria bacterium CG1_02_37_44]PIV50876.1 MAG: cell division ATP-binding protein FtsE [Candidatus Falkowbacteria bacterium CG02_land_8_20_14_3_00_36_14]PIX11505.1 MAG: cell division ATP-binding protein FtsE [Candidatus Falkowbacteria bacterium CG_4_8_14_3_um_filter_36_11]PJB19377.1 MAG: cell division ATP-binding protein FtsE [Candidatus Falkowbacteria bacterium CG_4_9_14_3_um_filter_36_9]
MIKLFNISKFYKPDIKALNMVNLHIKPGEFVSIVGQSGTGKTTIVKTLIGEEKVDQGKVIVGGWDITNIGQREIPILRRQIGVIFQDFKLLPKKTLLENVSFALQVCGQTSKKINYIVPQVMKIVGLEDKVHRYPQEISGGEQQRVAIARSLVHRPKILLADEPTGNLDSINAEEIIELLLKINKFGTTVVLVTHNRDIVNKLKKRVITIENGIIVGDQAVGKYIL